jgi:restriction system protein
MSEAMRNSSGSIGTVAELTKYATEIEGLLSSTAPPEMTVSDPTVEDPATFALERHLEDFLVTNWDQTPLGKDYRIYEVDGEAVGRQYPTDTGPMDILAISNDGTQLLVVELKKGRASDAVIGQIQRYMGYVQEELAESNQTVGGAIIALEDDVRLRRALVVTNNIDFYRTKCDSSS